MKQKILPLHIHTIEQLLAPVGAVNLHKGIDVNSSVWPKAEYAMPYPFRSDHFAFLIINKGGFRVKLNLMEFEVAQGDILMLQPLTVREFLSLSSDCEVTTVLFSSDFLSASGIQRKNVEAIEFLSSNVNPLLSTTIDEMSVINNMLNLVKLKTDSNNQQIYQENVLRHLFSGFIYEISSLYIKQDSSQKVKGTRKEDLYHRFLRLLPKYFKLHRSVEAYANFLNVTPKYLSRIVKEISGKTAGDCIHETVLLESKILLNDLDLTISQIAEELNFSDQFQFSKYFKSYAGLNPSDYRKST